MSLKQTKTTIIATLGPACEKPETLAALVEKGARLFRINFSHGDFDQYRRWLDTIESLRESTGRILSVMADLAGPKIRTSEILDPGQYLDKGSRVEILDSREAGSCRAFGTTYPGFIEDLSVGSTVLIDDGSIVLCVTEKHPDRLVCTVVEPGRLFSRKGINLPDTDIRMPSITDRDWECVRWAIDNGLDFLSVSFVRSEKEIHELRQYLQDRNASIHIIAKIEKPQAVDHLEAIVNAADAVMIARGDLGVEMDLARVPLIQKQVIHLCREYARPCIVATQVLQSMIESHIPTRAEVSDIANAVFDMTDAVMLSGETAVGKHPARAVEWIARTAGETERYLEIHRNIHPRAKTQSPHDVTGAVANAVADMVDQIAPELVVLWSQTGRTARLLSNARIDAPIFAFSTDPAVCRRMNLEYGIFPVHRERPESTDSFITQARDLMLKYGLARPGRTFIFVAGAPFAVPGTTNAVIVHRIPE